MLGILGMGSPVFWRLHLTMAVLSILTLSVVDFLFTTYPLGKHTKGAASFLDMLFAAVFMVVMLIYEKTNFAAKEAKSSKRLYFYYATVMSVFFIASWINYIGWEMKLHGVFIGSSLHSWYNEVILALNVLLLICFIEGGIDGARNIKRICSNLFKNIDYRSFIPSLHLWDYKSGRKNQQRDL